MRRSIALLDRKFDLGKLVLCCRATLFRPVVKPFEPLRYVVLYHRRIRLLSAVGRPTGLHGCGIDRAFSGLAAQQGAVECVVQGIAVRPVGDEGRDDDPTHES